MSGHVGQCWSDMTSNYIIETLRAGHFMYLGHLWIWCMILSTFQDIAACPDIDIMSMPCRTNDTEAGLVESILVAKSLATPTPIFKFIESNALSSERSSESHQVGFGYRPHIEYHTKYCHLPFATKPPFVKTHKFFLYVKMPMTNTIFTKKQMESRSTCFKSTAGKNLWL